MGRAVIAVFRNSDAEIAIACREATVNILVGYPTDPETSPEVISDIQRRDVKRCWRKGMRDVAAISAETVLPIWSVQRRLFELGLGPNPYQSAKIPAKQNRMTYKYTNAIRRDRV